VIWAPLAIAVALGLLVSLAIYFIFFWPAVEPADGEDERGGGRPIG
jgi:hypothetical protein